MGSAGELRDSSSGLWMPRSRRTYMARMAPTRLRSGLITKCLFFAWRLVAQVPRSSVSWCALHHTPAEKERLSLDQRQNVSHKGDDQCSRHLSDQQHSRLSLSGVPYRRSPRLTMSGAPSIPTQDFAAPASTASTATTSNTRNAIAAIRRSAATANAGRRSTAAWWVGIIVKVAHERS